jgi:hypothetical protein
VRAPQSGVMRALVPLGRHVDKDALLGQVTDPFGDNQVDVRAPADGIVIGGSYLPVVHEGDALFHIGRLEGTKARAILLEPSELSAEYDKGLTAEIAEAEIAGKPAIS